MDPDAELIEQMPSDAVDFMKTEEERKPERFYYTIVAPSSFRTNSIYSMNCTIHDPKCDFDEPVVLRISIEDEDLDDDLSDLAPAIISQDVEMKPNHTEVISLAIGDISIEQNYKLVVKGISGVFIEREASLDLQTQTHSILIQTDKAIYKPNDCVKFRIFVLDSELKAAKINDDELSISFADSHRNLVKKWTNVKTINGVFSSELQLSDQPNLGEWKISVNGPNEQVKIAVIEVAEYVLPKFEAIIEGNDHFTLEDEKVIVNIVAKYTHGKSLRGKAIVTVTEEDNFGYFRFRRESVASQEESILIKKTFDIDGRETIEFNIKDELKYDRSERNRFFDVKNFKIDVEVVENLTGLMQSASKTVKVHKNTYDVSSDLTHAGLKRDSNFDVTISVRKQDGSCVTFIDPSKKKITFIREQFYTNVDESTKTETVHNLDDDGNLFLTLDIAKNESSFSIKTIYCGQETDLGLFYTTACNVMNKVSLNAKVLTERCRTYKEVEIELMSHYPFPTITYQIVARGKIFESNTIVTAFDQNDTEYIHRFKFVPTFDYAPRVQVVFYYVKDEQIVSTHVGVDLHDDFKNFIELETIPEVTEPGQAVDLTVRSNPNSFIGLLGVDKSVMILRGGNDLAHDEIWNELEMFHGQVKPRIYEYGKSRKRSLPIYHNEWSDFKRAGLITFSNTIEPIRVESCYKLMACDMMARSSCFSEPEGSVILPKIREEFPETWIWETFDSKTDGVLTLKKTVPDSLTTWLLTGFSIHPEHGLAITRSPTNLRVEQPFHISLNLPYSVKRGEIISIPVSIFNYLANDVDAEVRLENENDEFEFVDSAINDQIYPEITKQIYRQKKAFIPMNDAVNVNFCIRPTKIGSISLKVTATTAIAADCIIKPLLVECEGVTKYFNKAVFIDLREKSKIDEIVVKIDIPKDALPDSTRIDVNCMGDLLGGTIKNLEHLIRLPSGCGEQNMLNLAPNIVILNYLKNTQQLVPVIEQKAKRFMEIGYQRELTYKHRNGAFSAFGESDKCGSTWLTAFVARSFRQAAAHIAIDEHIIDECLRWLSETQTEDGSFAEKGSVCYKEMQSGAANGVALTAYVLTAFLMNKDSKNTYAQVIDKAIENISKSIQTLDDAYAIAVVSYALELANHSSKKELIDRLLSLAKTNENYQWWEKTIGKGKSSESKTLNVEITAYALLTLLSSKKDSECLPIVKWLLNQRNDQGGFDGTQDTIVGLESLANFALKITSKDTKIKIELNSDSTVADGKKKVYFDVNADNALILQSQKIPFEAESLRVNASGKGFALLEVAYRYNTNDADPKSAFTLTTNAHLPNKNLLKLEIQTQYQPQDAKDTTNQSNMAILEISMPSGFVIGTETLDRLKMKFPTIKRIETKNSETVGIIYFDHIGTETITLNVDGYREHEVDEQKPTTVHIYDYYDNSSQAREFYSIEKAPEKMELT